MNKKKPPYTIDFPASLVREAVGLDIDEKVMLFVIASHETFSAFASREKFEQQLGFRGNRLYKVRNQLVEKKLITYSGRAIGKSTVYRLNRAELLKWVQDPDRARLRQRNDAALRQDDRQRSTRPHKLGTKGVARVAEEAKSRRGRRDNT